MRNKIVRPACYSRLVWLTLLAFTVKGLITTSAIAWGVLLITQ
ncbi:MAG: hypothetical protein ACI8W7_003612 [Gammaproteobacteria bacterium]|jgi:hypothetical protein